ncbi:MAG: hypothetical protein K8I00_08675, partial [Candidatus Omnitrophica bacterium]|nr:hypothetical protein [Candidatus Omnitrophota bacterium]
MPDTPKQGQHLKELAAGRWAELSFAEQMGNIGSEISRALNWQKKGRLEMSLRAVDRALDLLDLSLAAAETYPRLKEIARAREAVVDYFYGDNEFGSSEKLWRGYFDWFGMVARKKV